MKKLKILILVLFLLPILGTKVFAMEYFFSVSSISKINPQQPKKTKQTMDDDCYNYNDMPVADLLKLITYENKIKTGNYKKLKYIFYKNQIFYDIYSFYKLPAFYLKNASPISLRENQILLYYKNGKLQAERFYGQSSFSYIDENKLKEIIKFLTKQNFNNNDLELEYCEKHDENSNSYISSIQAKLKGKIIYEIPIHFAYDENIRLILK